jgi:MFS transporter, DHA1 family, multidrug resistance protein
MFDLVRDTFFSRCVRLATGGRLFKYPEEVDSSIWKRYIDVEKSTHMARHGQPSPPDNTQKEEEQATPPRPEDSRTSSATEVNPDHNETHDALFNGHSRHVDPEKGKDSYIVSWYGDDDPEVSPRPLPAKLAAK